MSLRMIRSFAWLLAASSLACGGAPPPAPSQPAPLVHRFEHAEQWAKEFDDPARYQYVVVAR